MKEHPHKKKALLAFCEIGGVAFGLTPQEFYTLLHVTGNTDRFGTTVLTPDDKYDLFLASTKIHREPHKIERNYAHTTINQNLHLLIKKGMISTTNFKSFKPTHDYARQLKRIFNLSKKRDFSDLKIGIEIPVIPVEDPSNRILFRVSRAKNQESK
jgi:cell division protein FtsI/penicillin-binding protein 2